VGKIVKRRVWGEERWLWEGGRLGVGVRRGWGGGGEVGMKIDREIGRRRRGEGGKNSKEEPRGVGYEKSRWVKEGKSARGEIGGGRVGE